VNRLLASRHIDSVVGAFAIVLGAFFALCLIVGLANVLIWIGEAV
jgi:hypothetical protein